jgi:RNA polymerase sigma-70 factor (ECF subfamily)
VIGFRKSGHGPIVSRAGSSSIVRAQVALGAENDDRFNTLVGTHFDFVWRLFRRMGLARVDADDASQQVFMIVSRRLSDIEPGTERTFLYGTTRRVLANLRRSLRRRRETGDEALPELVASDPLPDEVADRRRSMAFLDRVLARLPAPLKRVIVLADVEELSVPEIAALEAIPTGTVASRLRRARAAFREELERATRKRGAGGGDA